jgi:shikimate kinase
MTSPQLLIPNSQFLIFLVGMPGAGKSYWGSRVAARHQLQFIDLDEYISVREKATINELFEKEGEKVFRDKERQYLTDIINKAAAPLVIACGGGTPCFHDNMQLMKDVGTVIYLEAGVSLLRDNLDKEKDVRPLLKNRGDLPAFLENMLLERRQFYRAATIILQAKDVSITTFDEIIATCINPH